MQQVTLLVPNYKTLELTKLCLRLLRKYTDPKLAKVVVIDNDSQDASTEYLRSLKWIELIERPKVLGEPGFIAHSKALDLALEKIETPFVLSIHTDTLVKRSDWLPFLLKEIGDDENLAGVGSWKLELTPWWKRWFKKERGPFYLRGHCAMFRTKALKENHLKFLMGDGVPGKEMHRLLLEKGYRTKILPAEVLLPYVDHVNHATMILNPELGASKRTIEKGRKRLARQLATVQMDAVLLDDALDN